jgi:hypothetical protein
MQVVCVFQRVLLAIYLVLQVLDLVLMFAVKSQKNQQGLLDLQTFPVVCVFRLYLHVTDFVTLFANLVLPLVFQLEAFEQSPYSYLVVAVGLEALSVVALSFHLELEPLTVVPLVVVELAPLMVAVQMELALELVPLMGLGVAVVAVVAVVA